MSRGDALRVHFDNFDLDEADARLRRDGSPVALAPKAFAVLCMLVRQPGTLVTKTALLDAVWGHQHVSESVLKTTISEVRAALTDDARHPRYIETASRRGYRFIGRPQSAVVTAPALPATARVPARSATEQFAFVGRELALDKLRQCWRRATAGERQLVWIAGDAGVGKTRLIDTFLSELDSSCVVTLGQCVEHFGMGEPYLPLLEAMKELCRREPELIAMMRAAAPTWLVQMPWLVDDAERARLHAQVAGAHQDRMVREMRELMDRFTAKRPLAFVLEDLHWSDEGTLRMMEHFARRPRQVKLMWIASFRLAQVVAEEHPLRDLRQELRLHRLCEEILLEPFSEAEVNTYIESRVPNVPVPESFVRRIHRHTDGLPLFVANVMDTLLAQASAEPTNAASWLEADTLPVPDSLAGVIEKQIGRLPAETGAMLEAASVCGVEFRAGIVADMLGREAQWVNERCEELERRRFWLSHIDIVERRDGSFDNRYAFTHALYRHVFYQRLSVPQRVQLHRHASRALESSRAAGDVVMAAELASHYERGHQPLPALKRYVEAARQAFAGFAPREAVTLTTKALQVMQRCPQSEERMDAELQAMHTRGLACAQLYGVGAAETFAAVDRARQLCEALPETPARALLLNGIGFSSYVRGDYPAALALATRVEATGQRHSDPALLTFAFLLRGIVQSMQAEHAASRATLEKGLAIYEAGQSKVPMSAFVVDPGVALRVYLTVSLMNLGLPDSALAHATAARARAKQTGQPSSLMLSSWLAGMIEERRENVQRVAELASELRSVVETHMLTQGEGPVRWLQGWLLTRSGSPREGFELIREGHELQARMGMYAGKTEVLAQCAEALLLDGDWAGAKCQIDEATALADRIQEHVERTHLLLLRARVARGMNDAAGEIQYITEALADAQSRGLTYHELTALLALVDADKATPAHRQRLKQLYDDLTEGFDMPVARRAAEVVRGM